MKGGKRLESAYRRLQVEKARLVRENRRLKREQEALRRENARLKSELERSRRRERAFRRQAWGRKSEKTPRPKKANMTGARPKKASDQSRPRQKRGPKPFDPALPREKIQLPDPPAEKLECPVTGQRMQPGFTEMVEVLRIIPARVIVQQYERTVFVSRAKSAPVCTPWPEDIFPRQRVHASVLGHIAAEHFAQHQPYHRLEKKLERMGVRLPRATQVALMKFLDELAKPTVDELKRRLFAEGYVHLDATPVRVCDPARRGGTVEGTVWGYRVNGKPLCWYQYAGGKGGKSPDHPDRELKAAGFKGTLQVDGASGLSKIGPPGQVFALGCHSHGRRYAFNAVADGDENARVYLDGYNRLFRIDRLARHFRLNPRNWHALRMRHSGPLFELMVAMAEAEIAERPPGTLLWECLNYLVQQQEYLRRAITTPGAELTNNQAERNLRPLKTGQRNWLWVGHPSAGQRLANLFTLVENCRQAGADVEAYLTDLAARLPSHPAKRIGELLPAEWKSARSPAATNAPAA
jgi:transposase